MRTGNGLGWLVAAAAVLASPVVAQDGGGRKLTATLVGTAEKPGPGDPDGSGTFTARVNPGQGQLCYTLTATTIATATMAHIHIGGLATSGPVVVPLVAPSNGKSETCTTIGKDLAQKLIRDPGAYYVNVHNTPYPTGAIRGQLAR